MSQIDILILLEEKIKQLELELSKLDSQDEKMDKLWDESLTKDDIAAFLGISVIAVSNNLRRLLIQDEIIGLRREQDKRKRRYCIKNENIINMVNSRHD